MILLKRTNSSDADFVALVKKLDAYLALVDGDDHSFYDQFNKLDAIKNVVVAYKDDTAVGCGAMKELGPQTMEIKRMYTDPANRGEGIASIILQELEGWAIELQYGVCMLETGIRQAEAISLYHKLGYQPIPNYGQYAGVATSLCFEKHL